MYTHFLGFSQIILVFLLGSIDYRKIKVERYLKIG